MNGEVTKTSSVLEDLEVAQASNEKIRKIWVTLPSTYSQKELPVDNSEVATAEKLSKWKYLNGIKSAMNKEGAKEVTLLIGANCVQALEPRQVISSQNGGPYAFRTILGWCVVEPMQNSKPSEGIVVIELW